VSELLEKLSAKMARFSLWVTHNFLIVSKLADRPAENNAVHSSVVAGDVTVRPTTTAQPLESLQTPENSCVKVGTGGQFIFILIS